MRSESERVAITGIGVVSSLGRGPRAHLDAVRSSRSGISRISRFDATGYLCGIAGQVDDEWLRREYEAYDRFARHALVAACDAVETSGRDPIDRDPTRCAILIGTGLGGSETLDAAYLRFYGRDSSRIPPLTIPRAMYNAATSAVASELGAQGPSYGIVSACASGTHALGQAMHWIRSGLADAAIAGGADAPIVPGIVRAWEGLRVLAPASDSPATACRPFSSDRSGLVLAEGAAVMVLERYSRARARGAAILGELAGFGLSSDAGHLTNPSDTGAARAIAAALSDAGLSATDISYVNAHGTATRVNDPMETRAIRIAFRTHAEQLLISSTKAVHGHAMGASGAIEAALSLACLNERVVPPTMHCDSLDPECDLDYVPNEARECEVRSFISNSFGFGGTNGVVALRTRFGV